MERYLLEMFVDLEKGVACGSASLDLFMDLPVCRGPFRSGVPLRLDLQRLVLETTFPISLIHD